MPKPLRSPRINEGRMLTVKQVPIEAYVLPCFEVPSYNQLCNPNMSRERGYPPPQERGRVSETAQPNQSVSRRERQRERERESATERERERRGFREA